MFVYKIEITEILLVNQKIKELEISNYINLKNNTFIYI